MQAGSANGAGIWVGLVIAALIGWALGWWGKKDQWTAYVYETSNLDAYYQLGPFETFEACQESAISALRGTGRAGVGTYECGLNCRRDPNIDLNICEETRD